MGALALPLLSKGAGPDGCGASGHERCLPPPERRPGSGLVGHLGGQDQWTTPSMSAWMPLQSCAGGLVTPSEPNGTPSPLQPALPPSSWSSPRSWEVVWFLSGIRDQDQCPLS